MSTPQRGNSPVETASWKCFLFFFFFLSTTACVNFHIFPDDNFHIFPDDEFRRSFSHQATMHPPPDAAKEGSRGDGAAREATNATPAIIYVNGSRHVLPAGRGDATLLNYLRGEKEGFFARSKCKLCCFLFFLIHPHRPHTHTHTKKKQMTSASRAPSSSAAKADAAPAP